MNTLQNIRNDIGIEGTAATVGALENPCLPVLQDGEFPGDDAPVVIAPGYRADDGQAEIVFPEAETAEEAAQEYVDGGTWGEDEGGTTWVDVQTWRVAYCWDAEAGEAVGISFGSTWHTVTVEPEEPDCQEYEDHDWQSPYDIVGGLKENPGVWGQGGGVIIEEVCARCGLHRTTDTWAQNRSTGEQGLRSVRYHRPEEE